MQPLAIFFGLVFLGWGIYYAKYPHGEWGWNFVTSHEWLENEHRAKRKQERRRFWAGVFLVAFGLFGILVGLLT